MTQSRRTYLRNASALVASLTATSATAAAKESAPAWDTTKLYHSGDRVSHNGSVWEATINSRNATPSASSIYWKQVSSEDGSNSKGESGSGGNNDGNSGGNGSTDNGGTSDGSGAGDSSGSSSANSALPETVFAPYDPITTNSGTALADHAKKAGTNYFHLAFVLGTSNGKPAWDGSSSAVVGESTFGDAIKGIHDAGGEVIVSFGGAAGPYLAQKTNDPKTLANRFEAVVDATKSTHLDIDEEMFDMAVVERRNKALAILQERRPEVSIEFTLPVTTRGLNSQGKQVVQDAIDKGVTIDMINVMTMNYGWVEPNAKTIKQSANKLHGQLAELFPDRSSEEHWGMIGLTPMIGVNNAGGTFSQEDAKKVLAFAQKKGVGLLSFWSIDRDKGSGSGQVSPIKSGIKQSDYEFSKIFAPFTSG